jgi:hypothetical protein
MILLAIACSDVTGDPHDHDDNHGVTTTVVLTFEESGGAVESYTWVDAEADGDPEIDDIALVEGELYALSVELWNELVDPIEEVTPEILADAGEHQFFWTGSAIDEGLVEHSYADEDEAGLPVGLENTALAARVGEGELTVTLRHMPPESGQAVKTEGLAEAVAAEGFAAIGGDTDVQVTFPIAID